MIIRGILDSSLNGQLCIRGFAPIKELARISKADYSYQRNPLAEQQETIREFLDTEKYLFFPEIILSYKVKHSFDDSKNADTPLMKIQLNGNYKSSVDKTELNVNPVLYKQEADAGGKTYLTAIEIKLDDGLLNELIASKNPPFHRIDGNHRLKAAELTTTQKVNRMVAPFCILLGEEFYADNKLVSNEATEIFNKSVKIFFHNINTKTVPLTSEENLRVIVDDNINFPDEELEEILGTEALKTRQLNNKVKPEYFTGIEHILSKQYRTYYIDVFRRLLEKGVNPDEIVNKVFESLKAIDTLYNENHKLKANSSFGLLTTFLYYHIENNKAKYNFFTDWVLSNHIFEIQEIKAESIIKIFDKIAEKNISVFVAMPYYEGSAEIMETFNQAYQRVIDKIKDNYKHVSISLIPIMQYEGKTRDIIVNMINEIKQCSIFVADITGGNANVGYELGIARGLKKPTIIVRQKGDNVKVPFDYEHDVRNPYNEKAIATLESEVYDNIVAILSDEYGYIIEKGK
ncbi:MAG: hypothetical protein U0V74_01930 [Chitinophagales bacterium]